MPVQMNSVHDQVKDNPPENRHQSVPHSKTQPPENGYKFRGMEYLYRQEIRPVDIVEEVLVVLKHRAYTKGFAPSGKHKVEIVIHVDQDIRQPKKQTSLPAKNGSEDKRSQAADGDVIAQDVIG